MIVLIVDDEPAVKESMEIMIDWEKYGITQVLYAPNGRDALSLLEAEKPDIMFCDMQMPVMDGEQLLSEIAARGMRTKVIAVSGYNDFHYVKATLQVNGIDYILKPIVEEEVFAALEKAVALCQKESSETSKDRRYQKMSEEVSIQYLREWLNGKQKFDDNVRIGLSSLGMCSDEIFTAVIILQNPLMIREELFQGDGALMRFSLVNVVKEIFGSSPCHLIDIDEFLYVLLVDGNKINTYKVMLERFLNVIDEMFRLKALTECDDEAVPVQKVFHQIEMMKYRLLSRKIEHPETAVKKGSQLGSIKGIEGILYSAIRDKNMQGLNEIITDLCDSLRLKKDLTLRELQFQTIEMNLALGRLAHENLNDPGFKIELMSVWIFDLKIWKEVLKDRLYKMAEYQPEDRLNIEAVYRFLQENYADDVSIHTLTEYFCQSPQHISKKFKEKYGITIITKLRQIRIEHAKRLLRTGSASIIEIAQVTGYDDENYFSKVFKKEIGMSPKNYRNQFQKEKL